jgi:hypothetical protein
MAFIPPASAACSVIFPPVNCSGFSVAGFDTFHCYVIHSCAVDFLELG